MRDPKVLQYFREGMSRCVETYPRKTPLDFAIPDHCTLHGEKAARIKFPSGTEITIVFCLACFSRFRADHSRSIVESWDVNKERVRS